MIITPRLVWRNVFIAPLFVMERYSNAISLRITLVMAIMAHNTCTTNTRNIYNYLLSWKKRGWA
jgi:hypothetical protein